MPKTKHKLSKRGFVLPEHVDEVILKGVKSTEIVLTEQDPKVVTQLLSILAMPPCPISHRQWCAVFNTRQRGIIFDDRENEGPVPIYFVQLLPGNGVIHVKPMSGA